MKKKFFIICGPNVIESEKHTLYMAEKIKEIMDKWINIYKIIIIKYKIYYKKLNKRKILKNLLNYLKTC